MKKRLLRARGDRVALAALVLLAPLASPGAAAARGQPAVLGRIVPGTRHNTGHATSSNWAGYAAMAPSGFRQVSGTWVQPALKCQGSVRSYSAFWVGLGGFAPRSRALEQTGTESDCIGGRNVDYAWYELVPAGEVRLRLKVHPGDRMAASVAVTGTRVVLHLRDLSTGRGSHHALSMRAPDVSSAEWIAEAPSECDEGGRCQTLQLADFGTASFEDAQTLTRAGRAGTVTAHGFAVTALTLQSGGLRLGVPGPAFASASSVEAVPGPLSESGRSFTVTYKQAAAPYASRRTAPAHP